MHVEALAILTPGANPRILQLRQHPTRVARLQRPQRHPPAVVWPLVVGVDAAFIRMPDMIEVLITEPALGKPVIDEAKRHIVRPTDVAEIINVLVGAAD